MRERVQCEFFAGAVCAGRGEGRVREHRRGAARGAGTAEARRCGLRATGAGCDAWIADADVELLEALEGELAARLRMGEAGAEAGDGDAGGVAIELGADDARRGRAWRRACRRRWSS